MTIPHIIQRTANDIKAQQALNEEIIQIEKENALTSNDMELGH